MIPEINHHLKDFNERYNCMRNGEETEVHGVYLLVGDLIQLRERQNVPALIILTQIDGQ
jgi:magnesium-transporting ATPase (P-type)